MSVEATAAVWAMRGLSGTEKVVAVRIADHAGPDGRNAYPSVARLAADTGLGERTVQCALSSLVDKGVLARDHKPGPKGTRRYTVNLQWGAAAAPPQQPHPAPPAPPQDAHPKGAAPAPQPPQQPHPNRPRTVSEPSTTNNLPAVTTDVEVVFEAWKESTGRTNRTVLDPKRRKLITAALRTYPLDDVLDAVAGWKSSPFHRGENASRTVYNDLDVLLRDAGHIEKFRDMHRGHAPEPIRLAKGQAAVQRAIRRRQ